MANEKLKLTIEQLRDLGVLTSGRAFLYFQKHQLLTAEDICNEHERYNGDWAHRSEKGTPVKESATKIYDYCLNNEAIDLDQSKGQSKYRKLEALLDKKLRNKKDLFIKALSQDNIYLQWYKLIELYFDKANELELLKYRFLIIDPEFKKYDYWGNKSGKVRTAFTRMQKSNRIDTFIQVLLSAELLVSNDFSIEKSGTIHSFFPHDKDEYLGSGMGLAFINYAVAGLYKNYMSVSDLLNDPRNDKKIVDDSESIYFFDATGLDQEYILDLLTKLRKDIYNGRQKTTVSLDKTKVKENEVISDLMTYVLKGYNPVYNEDLNCYNIQIREVLPSLLLAIQQIFKVRTGNAEGANAFKANSKDLKQIIDNESEYEHLRDKTDKQIKEALYSSKNLWSINQNESYYRMVSALKYGKVNSIGVLLAVLNIKENCTGLSHYKLCEEIHEAGYEWTDDTLEQNLRIYKKHFKEENGKWFSLENK